MRKIFLATSNLNKAREVKEVLSHYFITVEHVNIEPIEIQSDRLEDIAKERVKEAFKIIKKPLITEDSGLFIESLRGFPGPYSSYVYRTIGNGGILKLMEGVENRKAFFKSTIAYCEAEQEPVTFTGEVEGVIAYEERGTSWGFDPIFIPKEGGGHTYAEMGPSAKSKLSHRRRALEKFAAWLLTIQEEG